MVNYKYESEESLERRYFKFMNVKLEDGEDSGTLFFNTDSLWEEVQRHVETISDVQTKKQ